MFQAVLFLYFFSVAAFAVEAPTDALLYDALVARVGRESVLLSDLGRFQEVEKVMACAGLRKAPDTKTESTAALLNRYVEEELIYQDARSKKISTAKMIPDAIAMIRSKKDCEHDWQNLGKKFSSLWATENRPVEGQSILVLELEKRLLVDRYLKGNAISDRELWAREAKVKTIVKLYLD